MKSDFCIKTLPCGCGYSFDMIYIGKSVGIFKRPGYFFSLPGVDSHAFLGANYLAAVMLVDGAVYIFDMLTIFIEADIIIPIADDFEGDYRD